MLYALGFIGLFTIGGLTGLFLARWRWMCTCTDTYFVVAHFHYIMVGGTVMAYLGGIHFWWPKMTGRMYPEGWARLVGDPDLRRLQPDVLPAVHAGYLGMPRRYHVYPAGVSGAERDVVGRARRSWRVGYLLPLAYLLWSLRLWAARRRQSLAGQGLEWQTASPPPSQNFVHTPSIGDGPYAYEKA